MVMLVKTSTNVMQPCLVVNVVIDFDSEYNAEYSEDGF